MKIVIVGCGKVGNRIAEELVKENHDIVLVDDNATVVAEVSNSIDVLGVAGNGASIEILKEAGVEDADLLLAVTSADEINMLCCLFARKLNKNCKTIARVRNPVYNDEINYIRDDLGLSMTINPEMITAREIARLIRLPKALKVDSFAKGRFVFISFAVEGNQNIAGKTIREIKSIYRDPVLIAGIERGSEVLIPNGDTIIEANDKITIACTMDENIAFLNKIGVYQNPIKSVMIAGGSRVAYYLSTILLKNKIAVSIIDKDIKRCEELSQLLPSATIINGQTSDDNLLQEEGIGDTDCFLSLTGVDEENVLLSMYVKTVSNCKLITKVNHISYDNVLKNLDIGAVVSPKDITASSIISYVRAISNAGANDVETMHRILGNKAEALSFKIEAQSKVVDKTFEELNLIDNLLICSIIRNNKIITPSGKDSIQVGDLVFVVTTHKGLSTIEEIVR